MQRLYSIYGRMIAMPRPRFVRYIYKSINWENRLIVIKGARGVGKTTMILQHIAAAFTERYKALYVSVEHVWFATHSITELAEYHYTHGGTHLFLDEVHKYVGWEREVKNIYDSYPDLHIVVTGSSMLRLTDSVVADLLRRCRVYEMAGLSFREFLAIEGVAELPAVSLEDILANHFIMAGDIVSQVKVMQHFERYLVSGFYPFYREEGDGFADRLLSVVDVVLEGEIPFIAQIDFQSVHKIKLLLGVLAEKEPYVLNISSLCSSTSCSRNNLLKLLDLMDKAGLVRRVYQSDAGMGMLTKPEKILFGNTNLMYALSPNADSGTMRETFVASMLSVGHRVAAPSSGDFLVDGKHILEVGGPNKKYKQIKDVPDSYVVADGIDVGMGNRIPLWLFGMMY